ncbi:RluA family pseudouridine synthase [Anaerosacchariphilus polymeriproducens]|uniref:Pseudouridine synthase n=1 Tax=Anaerosacchariphilus polymeriproducens TaxID=1812858 RepID=A0A371ATX9_9FIRM|nr:RluA family pseudouridine synthase [Anaerosacchariphilus polymeriproducens]RDU23026.1 RluA family pseudouridine synthase [Anaerosacchariphilus polymeriproducens]
MKSIIVSENEAGQRLNKFLNKYLNEAPNSFIYKMLRKKNITLNEKKASGSEKLERNDIIKLFLSDETIDKFSNNKFKKVHANLNIIYEDSHVLFVNKPAGILSQKAKDTDVSIIEHILSYLVESNQLTLNELQTFRPSICNRLDRNTSGFMIAGKSLLGLQVMSRIIKDRTVQKFYRAIVKGNVKEEKYLKGYLVKEEKLNKVNIYSKSISNSKYIETKYIPVYHTEEYSILEVELITGRSHQIRAHLASIGHPIIGDDKYGDAKVNLFYKKHSGINHQLLHSYRIVIPQLEELPNLSNKEFIAKEPEYFAQFYKK